MEHRRNKEQEWLAPKLRADIMPVDDLEEQWFQYLAHEANDHRPRNFNWSTYGYPSNFIARILQKPEIARRPDAAEVLKKEWDRLQNVG